MPYPILTPYEVLEVTPAVSRDKLRDAYVRAGKLRKYHPTKLTKAFNDLRNGNKRLEIDVFVLSQNGDPNDLEKAIKLLPPFEFISSTVTPFELPFERILLKFVASEDHKLEIPENPFNLQIFSPEIDPKKCIPILVFPW